MYITLAWRNIWRNKRRTFVIIAAVFTGVWSMVFLSAFARGMVDNMLENGKSVLVNDIQIHHKAYREDPSVENSMEKVAPVTDFLDNHLSFYDRWTRRIRVSAYVSNATHSAGVSMVAIDPLKEKHMSFIGSPLFKGEYLKPGDKQGVLLGYALMNKLDTGIGKKLIIMTRNKRGKIVSKAFRIKGVFKAEMEAIEKDFVFITMAAADNFLNMNHAVSEISIKLAHEKKMIPLTKALKQQFSSRNLEIETWKELLPMLNAYVSIFNGFMYIWYMVVFTAMGFGIVNTSLMAVFERVREFGLLRALGMKPVRVIGSVISESIIILGIGIAAGNLFGFISIFILHDKGLDLAVFGKGAEFFGMSRVIYPVLTINDLVSINLIILCLGIIVSLYPAVRAAQIPPVEAMRE
ncbi:MAG: FtsX-like permease family protein [Desulfobacteraceae bacterium]